MASSATLRETSDRTIRKTSRRVVARGAAAGLRPDPLEKVSDGAERFRIVPEMGSLPGRWRNEVAPYLTEIMDALSPDEDCERVIVIKPAQSGGSAVAENWIGFICIGRPARPCISAPPFLRRRTGIRRS